MNMKRMLAFLLVTVMLLIALPPVMGESTVQTFSLNFTFDERGPNTLDTINAALGGMKLSMVSTDVASLQGYTIRTTITKDLKTRIEYGYGYGFDSITLLCEQNGEDAFVWQIDAGVFPEGLYQNNEAFKKAWENANPDFVIRKMDMYSYDDGICAFLFLYHNRL